MVPKQREDSIFVGRSFLAVEIFPLKGVIPRPWADKARRQTQQIVRNQKIAILALKVCLETHARKNQR